MINLLENCSFTISKEQLDKFDKFYELLILWNEKMNLTSITESEEVKTKHFLDSIYLLNYIPINELANKKIIDVGTGAGFPGIPLAIMCPNTDFVLLDSLNKRVGFLNEVINKCELTNVKAIHGRAEDKAHEVYLREQFDFVVSRAVANLSTLSEYCIPFIKVEGMFLPYKSIKTELEIDECKTALEKLSSEVTKIEKFELPGYDSINRSIVFIKKNKPTDLKYPRKAGKPSKKPL